VAGLAAAALMEVVAEVFLAKATAGALVSLIPIQTQTVHTVVGTLAAVVVARVDQVQTLMIGTEETVVTRHRPL
jgi:hypothetical protein